MKNLLVPEIDSTSLCESSFVVYFDKDLIVDSSLLSKNADLNLYSLKCNNLENFKVHLSINGIAFLCCFFNDRKEIRLYTPRLNQELFLENLIVKKGEELSFYPEFKTHLSLAKNSFENEPSQVEILTKLYELEDISKMDSGYNKSFDKEYKATKKELLKNIHNYSSGLFEKASDIGLGLTANYALIRIHLLKFLAILPSLDHDKSGREVKRILLEALRRLLEDNKQSIKLKKKGQNRALPSYLIISVYLISALGQIVPASILATLIRYLVRLMATRFIAGENIDKVSGTYKNLLSSGRDVTFDQLGELVVSEKEADEYLNKVLEIIKGLKNHVKKGSVNGADILRAHVSIKVSALCSDFRPEAFTQTYHLVAPRLIKILLEAKKECVFINIDAEHYHYRDLVFKIYQKVLLDTKELHDFAHTGIVLQAYLRDASIHLDEIIALAKSRNILMPIRLVKGAYWDAETIEADAHNFSAPQFLNKEETDIHFRQMIHKIFKNGKDVQLCIASHNFTDHCYSEVVRKEFYSDTPEVEHQCLHMTYEALSTALSKMDWPTRNYIPIGNLLVGMAYLVRRIMENSSQVGVLTIMRSHKTKAKVISPVDRFKLNKKNNALIKDKVTSKYTSAFINVTPLKLYTKELIEVKNSAEDFKFNRPIDKLDHLNGDIQEVICPSDGSSIVGKIQKANETDIKSIIASSRQEFYHGDWSKYSWKERLTIMLKAANIMLARRLELSAVIMYESGKIAHEALSDVDEAIDFINFYARQEYKIQTKQNALPRGPIGIIAPWNFPLAIACGMSTAALCSGNTVILKPAEQTPIIAYELMKIFFDAGVPKDAFIFTPGKGSIVGEAIVTSPDIAGIVFTGSKEVGLNILKKAQAKLYKNEHIDEGVPKLVITEMGGKNGVIVTASAELDETVEGIVFSAFSHAGQKCSACSRVIVHESVIDKLAERLTDAARDIKVGKAEDFSTYINPINSKKDHDRLIEEASLAKEEAVKSNGKVLIDRSGEDLPGYCVGPSIFQVPAKVAMSSESIVSREFFGPIIHLVPYTNLDHALDIFNSTEYALTGGIFSQSEDDIEYLASKMSVGNIYVNRSITGARVAIEPFGGHKMSGTGPKAGGIHYLPSFHLYSTLKTKVEPINVEGVENGYFFDLCESNKIDHKNILRLFSMLHNQFKKVDTSVNIKANFMEHLLSWTKNDYIQFFTTGLQNRSIPGQINFNDFNFNKKNILILSNNTKVNSNCFASFCTAILIGSGVTVSCSNQESFNWWSIIRSFAQKVGIDKRNFDVYLSSKRINLEVIDKYNPEVIFVDSVPEDIEIYRDAYIGSSEYTTFVKTFLTNYDYFDINDIECLIEKLSHTRSFAINIMRHGAPLELERNYE